MNTYGIFHFMAGHLKGTAIPATSETDALTKWATAQGYGADAVTTREDGRPCITFTMQGAPDVIFHQYTARVL